MPDYKRFVAHIYLYDKGIRIKNVGYAKVNNRDQTCHVDIRLRGITAGTQGKCKAYFFKRNKEQLQGIHFGDINVTGGSAEASFRTSEMNLMESGVPFTNIGGIYIQAGSDTAFATEWDDLGVQGKSFVLFKKEHPIESEEFNVVEEPAQEPQNQQSVIPELSPELSSAETEAPAADTDQMAERIKDIMEKEQTQQAKESAQKSRERKSKHIKQVEMTWEKMQERYPSYPAFQDKEIIDCIRVEPKDLITLPKQEWALGNNSFMLHGYYNYKYLLMGRKISEGEDCIILGIPGVYHKQEKMMANMFGFPSFKQAKNEELKTGVFGYWFRVVTWERRAQNVIE